MYRDGNVHFPSMVANSRPYRGDIHTKFPPSTPLSDLFCHRGRGPVHPHGIKPSPLFLASDPPLPFQSSLRFATFVSFPLFLCVCICTYVYVCDCLQDFPPLFNLDCLSSDATRAYRRPGNYNFAKCILVPRLFIPCDERRRRSF